MEVNATFNNYFVSETKANYIWEKESLKNIDLIHNIKKIYII